MPGLETAIRIEICGPFNYEISKTVMIVKAGVNRLLIIQN
jgi:hypothetical protein